MSDIPRAPGWWRAADGRWYPPPAPSQVPQQVWVPVGEPAPPPASPRGARPRRTLLVVGLIVLGVALISVGAWAAGSAVGHHVFARHQIVYSVTGNGTTDVTYDVLTSSGVVGTSEAQNSALPWTRTFVVYGFLDWFTLTARLKTGSVVNCTIRVDGRLVSTQSDVGRTSSVQCEYGGAD